MYISALLKSAAHFQNPSKPHFNHYLFESLCLSVRITCKSNPTTVGSFEEALFPVFTEILQNDVQGHLTIKLINLHADDKRSWWLIRSSSTHHLLFVCYRVSSIRVSGDVSPARDPLQLYSVFLHGFISSPAAASALGANRKHPPSGAPASGLPGEGRGHYCWLCCR